MKGDMIKSLVVTLLLLGAVTAAAASLQRVTIAGKASFWVEVVSTPEERARGLGYRDSLPLDQGMLFLFEEPDYHAFWMRGMRFPLDILWIREGVVVHIEENIPPPSPLHLRLPTYRPAEKADSVLEINAGLVQKYGLQLGDTVDYR
ncbi:MAG: DUF192 domain-containing protein [Nitrospinota bacterium]|nr:MAG: DUF192 domain-containing protein [Nitrospinota bacterium]